MKKLLLVLPVLLVLAGGGAYKFLLAKPAVAAPRKIAGTLVPLPKEFVVNLAGGHYGKVSVAVVVSGHLPHAPAGEPPVLEQDAAVRAVITDELTGIGREQLVNRSARHRLLQRILKVLRRQTDEEIDEVLFTDLAVQ